MIRFILAILLISLSATYAVDNHKIIGHSSTFFSEASLFLNPHGHGRAEGTQWAVLVAGSNTWGNYRHQADVCHAYQILKKGGLKDENIIVMMYDDIADNPENPRPGVIINSPNGSDVYKGVPKDYTGEDVTGENFFNVLLGNKTAIKGGNGKVVNSGPNDHIFVYYVDHGSPLILGMPNDEYITAQELNKVLKKKHAMKTYKSMVFYLEACEAGSMFNGLLPKNIKIYATTASTPHEQSFAYYCPGEENPPPKEFNICLGDLYSISWMEDWDRNSTEAETLKQQFEKVKKRTANFSQVLEYGDLSLSEKNASAYLGKNPAKDAYVNELLPSQFSSVHQRDAKLLHLREKFRRAPKGSQSKLEAKKQIIKALKDRVYIDNSIEMITKLLFGSEKGLEVMKSVRPVGQAPVDDWDCFKTLLHTYQAKCGTLTPYGRKHTRIFANFCNAGIRQEQMEKATTQVCA